MPSIPGIPNIPGGGIPGGGGLRQQRAAQIRAEAEARMRRQQAAAEPEEDDAQQPEGEEAVEEGEAQGTGPVGQGDYVVKEGQCISSIAKDTGHFWKTIWDEPANSELREIRQDPNVLLPGDRVTVPDIRPKQEPGETEMRHRFVRKGEPAMFRVRILEDDEPRAGEPYTVEVIGGAPISGTTDADGLVQFNIPGSAKGGVLRVGEAEDQLELDLSFGHLSPVSEVTGVQQRLKNLGYDCGPLDGVCGARTRAAVKTFQAASGLPPTGKIDEATRRKLQEQYGS